MRNLNKMANCCITTVVVAGPRGLCKELFAVMKALQEMAPPGLLANGYGSRWLGNLVTRLGGDWKTMDCRGRWDWAELTDRGVEFSYESAWAPKLEVHELIERRFPGLRVVYSAEEGCCDIYETNDVDGEFFTGNYVLYAEDSDQQYLSTLSEVITEVERITGRTGLSTLGDCQEALDGWGDAHGRLVILEPVKTIND